jgi:DNA-binding LytR/AlgR family response regulator
MIVSKLVTNHVSLNLIGEFSNAIKAKNFISYNSMDLLFLDIEMPVVSGFDFLDGLKTKPQVIFITAKPEYAVKAFDYDATDYLQKPITNARFDAAINRAINLQMLLTESQDEDAEHIFIKSKLKKMKVFTSKIKWIEALGDYLKVITEDESHLVLSTMKSFETDLPGEKFVRVHKSYIVNIEKVDKFNSKYAEIGTSKIPLSRNKKDDLKRALEGVTQ